jgi:hypothetical protein
MREYYDDPRISQSKLKDWLKCPNYYRAKHVDKIIEQEPTDAMIYGRVVDTLVTQPDEFDKEFSVVPRLPKGERYDGKGRRLINETTYKKALKAHEKIMAQPVMEMFQQEWMQNQVPLYTEKHKALLDYFGIDEKGHGWIVDLKTMQDTDRFEESMHIWGWWYQLFFYNWVAKQVYPKIRTWRMYVIGIDKTKDQKFGVWKLDRGRLSGYMKMFMTQTKLINTGVKLTKGRCTVCPIEVNCSYSKFHNYNIQTIKH